MDYIKYLNQQIKRLELIQKYQKKADSSNKEKTKNYYIEGMRLLFQDGENIENYLKILEEYREALISRKDMIDKLYQEINIIKHLKV